MVVVRHFVFHHETMKLRERKKRSSGVAAVASSSASSNSTKRKRTEKKDASESNNDDPKSKTKIEKRKNKVHAENETKDSTKDKTTSVSIGSPGNHDGDDLQQKVEEYINSIDDAGQQSDVRRLHDMVTTLAPKLDITMDFKNTLGYGKYHYKYKTGREGDWYKIGIVCGKTLSMHFCALTATNNDADDDNANDNNKHSHSQYILQNFSTRIGKKKSVKCGKSCVRFKSLDDDIDINVLKELIQQTETANIMT